MKRLRVGIIFGGRSVEHEVSLVSARSLLAAMDPARYEIVPIGVTRAGKWLTSSHVSRFLAEGMERESGEHAAIVADPSVTGMVRLDGGAPGDRSQAGIEGLDVVFPLIHGQYGEDGKLQGLLEMADLAYVGSGVLGSAMGMDKEVAKRLFALAGLPQCEYIVVRRSEWEGLPGAGAHRAIAPATKPRPGPHGGAGESGEAVRRRIEESFGYPCFVKPASLGSSVAVSKAAGWEDVVRAISVALEFDDKVLIERSVDAREIETAVLGNDFPQASICGEITTAHEFYDYEAKYHDDTTRLLIPAPISDELSDRIRTVAIQAFRVLELAGMARVDFLLDRTTGKPYLNEVNTIPGFTPVSMYPKLWEATGLSYPALVDRLIELALDRHRGKCRLKTSRGDT